MAWWSRTARRVVGGCAVLLVLPLAGCGTGGGAESACEETMESITMSVDGVSAAQFECRRSFGNSWEKGSVTVTAATEAEAVTVMEDVLRTYAASAEIDDASGPVLSFESEDGSILVGPTTVGFNGTPAMDEVREHYGIQP